MTAFSATSSAVATDDRLLHAAIAARLGRYKGQSRLHASSDLQVYHRRSGYDPLAAAFDTPLDQMVLTV